MGMTYTEIDYLRQVLGVEAIFSAGSAGEKGQQTEPQNLSPKINPLRARLAFVSANQLEDRDRDLIEKMATAMGCTDFFATDDLADPQIMERGVGFVITFGDVAITFGETPQFDQLKKLALPNLAQFFDESSAAELKKLKKTTWDQLKKFKIEMDN